MRRKPNHEGPPKSPRFFFRKTSQVNVELAQEHLAHVNVELAQGMRACTDTDCYGSYAVCFAVDYNTIVPKSTTPASPASPTVSFFEFLTTEGKAAALPKDCPTQSCTKTCETATDIFSFCQSSLQGVAFTEAKAVATAVVDSSEQTLAGSTASVQNASEKMNVCKARLDTDKTALLETLVARAVKNDDNKAAKDIQAQITNSCDLMRHGGGGFVGRAEIYS